MGRGGRRVSAERWAEIVSEARLGRSRAAEKRAAELLPAIESAKSEGARSLRQIAAALNAKDIPTPRGGQWSAYRLALNVTASAIPSTTA
jgi:Recombinase